MALKFFNPINFFYHVGQDLMYWKDGDKGNDKKDLENVVPFFIYRVLEYFLFLRKPSLHRSSH